MNSVKALKAKFLLQTYEAILVIVFVDVVVRYGNLAVSLPANWQRRIFNSVYCICIPADRGADHQAGWLFQHV